MWQWRWILALGLSMTAVCMPSIVAAEGWEAGFARRDITPNKPLRLSGYGSRTVPAEGTETPLQVRCMALRNVDQETVGPVHVLLAVDTIGFPAALTMEVLERVETTHGITRERLVVCGTHSHTAPHVARGLENLFSTPTTEEERANLEEYTNFMRDECVLAVDEAIAALAPARLFRATGEVTFAENRRVIQDGVWKGFGVNPEGPVDHSLPVLKITDTTGQQLRGVLLNYACHCTTFGGEYNRVNGDWAGYAARGIEAAHEGVFALCTIGCGADQNPPRDTAKALEYAQAEGSEIAEAVAALLTGPWNEIAAAPVARFGFAGLPIDRPEIGDLKQSLSNSSPQVRRHAEVMLETHARMGRLPESYPMPIQVWRFGDQFAMIFLGGEVCVEYALRIKLEFGEQTWVNAYCNDVFAYVAPERMRAEGGYEVDFSMIYYLQPGRWSTGTEEVIFKRIHELYDGRNLGAALSPDEALKTFQVPAGFRLELVAAEPLLADPINFAFGADGKLWVVEMGDYPRGLQGQPPTSGHREEPWDGVPGGRIKVLYDDNQDGQYDRVELFADGLNFPTGVFPWRDGVLVSGAPELLYLKDTDGDQRADVREVLYTGFEESNPQHRINGFEYALDGSLHLASGVSSGQIASAMTGETVNMSGRDLRIQPATGFLEPVSGRSQYGRCRDDFGNWYGNTNSEPLFYYAMEDADLRRNPYVPSPSPRVFLTEPHHAPAVYPTSRTADRFNDLYAENRFTSACSPMVYRDVSLTLGDVQPQAEELLQSVFICEPVHNLVSRVVVRHTGIVPTATRATGEAAQEFLSSSDPWFRPVRLLTGPDGAFYICDMYRAVIEHPEWIPESWQARIDLYAGQDRGRIYRLVPESAPPARYANNNLAALSDRELIRELAHPNSWHREIAQQLLLNRGMAADSSEFQLILRQLRAEQLIPCKLQQLWTARLLVPEFRHDELWRERILRSSDPEIVRHGLRVFDLEHGPQLKWQPSGLVGHADARVRFELALRAGDCSLGVRKQLLTGLAVNDNADPWMRAAILSSSREVASELLVELYQQAPPTAGRSALAEGLIATALGEDLSGNLTKLLGLLTPAPGAPIEPWRLESLRGLLETLDHRNETLDELTEGQDQALRLAVNGMRPLFVAARQLAEDSAADETLQATAIALLGREAEYREQDLQLLGKLLTATAPPDIQVAAATAFDRLGEYAQLVTALNTLSLQPQLTVQALLLSREQGPGNLLTALQEGQISVVDLSAATRSALLEAPQEADRQRAVTLFNVATGADRLQILEAFASVQTLAGDSDRGKVLFQKRCATCHRHGDVGVDLGPKLSALQDKSTDFLLAAILDPNRAVDSRYRAWSAALVDGRQLNGMLTEETATSLTFALPDGRSQTVLRRDLEELVPSRKSFMPEGLEKDVTPQDVADVLSFLRAP